MTLQQRIYGLLLGTAIGDSVGLPAEGLRPAAIQKLGWNRDWKQRFLFGHGMWSDDTEHTIILAQALARSGGDPLTFQSCLRRSLMAWLLFLPAGVGLATARSILKMWLAFPSHKTGVFSAGNGPAMRAAIIGARYHDKPEIRNRLNEIQTRLTHSDPKALTASRAVVELAAHFTNTGTAPDTRTLAALLLPETTDETWQHTIKLLTQHLDAGSPLSAFLTSIGADPARGISGYAYHTVPAVLFAGHQNQWHPEKTLTAIWSAGGDTDTAGAIAGALCGTLDGPDAFPPHWKNQIAEWPTSPAAFEKLASALFHGRTTKIRSSANPGLLLRNLLFLVTVLTHGLLRLRIPLRRSPSRHQRHPSEPSP